MFRTSICRPPSGGLRLSTLIDTRAVLHRRSHEYKSTRSSSYFDNWDESALLDPHFQTHFQPRFSQASLAAALVRRQRGERVQVMDSVQRRHVGGEELFEWLDECGTRFDHTGIEAMQNLKDRKARPFEECTDKNGKSDYKMKDPAHKSFENAFNIRLACRQVYFRGVLQEYIDARKLCAKLKDARFPVIYHSLEKQAHLIYVVGRVELERKKENRHFAWYMLSMAAGLGQLDAALLLHSLEHVDPSLPMQPEQRAVITAAAKQKLNWRAVVAHCDHLFATSTRRGVQQRRVPPEELEECLEMLEAAMSVTSSTREGATQRPVEADYLDVDSLERYVAPYHLLLSITDAEIVAGNQSARILELHEKAARVGGLIYQDPTAAWAYSWLQLRLDKKLDDKWLQCTKLAASEGYPDAAFQLARYYLTSERWHPSIASKVLAEQGNGNAKWERSEDEEQAIHDKIMARKKKRQIKLQEGMFWMEIAAQMNVHSATKMLNRYFIIAFLLRQNGFMEEGKAVLIKAKPEFKNCVDSAVAVKQATARLDEYLEYWDKKKVHQLLEPEMIGRLLDEALKF